MGWLSSNRRRRAADPPSLSNPQSNVKLSKERLLCALFEQYNEKEKLTENVSLGGCVSKQLPAGDLEFAGEVRRNSVVVGEDGLPTESWCSVGDTRTRRRRQ